MKTYRPNIDKLNVYQPGKPIEEVKRVHGLKKIYKLASNEVPFYPSYIRGAINKEIENINRYPVSDCFYLRRFLAKKLKVSEKQIVFGNGSDEIITLALRAFVDKGDQVVIAYPTFLIYGIQSKIQEANIKTVPLKNFKYNLKKMAQAVTKKTKIVFIANPDNPSGTYVAEREVKQFLKRIPGSVLVFFDEAYFEFAPSDFPKTLKFLKTRGNIIFTRTFSKAYGLAGLRIGYGITSPYIAEALNKVREPFNVNRFAQVAALEALKQPGFVRKVLASAKKEKKYLYDELSKLNISFIKSATNFILVDYKKDTRPLYDYLLKKGVIIRQLKGWGLNSFFRVTVGRHKENAKFIECLKNYIIGGKG